MRSPRRSILHLNPKEKCCVILLEVIFEELLQDGLQTYFITNIGFSVGGYLPRSPEIATTSWPTSFHSQFFNDVKLMKPRKTQRNQIR